MHFPLSRASRTSRNTIAPNSAISLHRNAHARGTTKRNLKKKGQRGKDSRREIESERQRKAEKKKEEEQKDRASLYVRNRSPIAERRRMRFPIGNRYRLSKAKPEPARPSQGRYARTHSKAKEIHACSLQTEAGLRRSIYGIAAVLAPISPSFCRPTVPPMISSHRPFAPLLPSTYSPCRSPFARAPIIPSRLRLRAESHFLRVTQPGVGRPLIIFPRAAVPEFLNGG